MSIQHKPEAVITAIKDGLILAILAPTEAQSEGMVAKVIKLAEHFGIEQPEFERIQNEVESAMEKEAARTSDADKLHSNLMNLISVEV